jgi:hypothetical protein
MRRRALSAGPLEQVPPALVELSLRVLAALVADRSHQTGVITALRGAGHPAVLSALVATSVSRLTSAPAPPMGAALAVGPSPVPGLSAASNHLAK